MPVRPTAGPGSQGWDTEPAGRGAGDSRTPSPRPSHCPAPSEGPRCSEKPCPQGAWIQPCRVPLRGADKISSPVAQKVGTRPCAQLPSASGAATLQAGAHTGGLGLPSADLQRPLTVFSSLALCPLTPHLLGVPGPSGPSPQLRDSPGSCLVSPSSTVAWKLP